MDDRTPDGPLRLNRFLARAGLGSRRGVETLITAGRVALNGVVVTALETKIDPARDAVTVDGRPVGLPKVWRVYAFHKPVGVVSTLRPQGSQTGLLAFRTHAGLPPGLVPIGRLDADTSGLLLWTDDGELAQALLRPARAVWKRYEVELAGRLAPDGVRAVARGAIELDGHPCLPARIAPLPGPPGHCWAVSLREGRNRQIRRMFAALGVEVQRLHRTDVGPQRLGRLPPGLFRRLTTLEITALRAAAGLPPP
ncbi:MAG: pseudouridine synthase [Candidatus Krumholzibacteriia bacterium]